MTKKGKTGKNQSLESFQRLAMILFRGKRNERKQYEYRSHRSRNVTENVQIDRGDIDHIVRRH